MPPYKKRQLKEELGLAAPNENEWKDAILQAVQKQMNKKRAVLIINRTIQDVNNIQQHLQKNNLKSVVYYDDSQKIDHEIKPNSLIIATNLAGRGIDLISNQELENNGGLHVIMSFLPRNIRIQQQGFGRIGRQGKKGTAQLIVNLEENLYIGQLQLDTIEDVIAFYVQKVNSSYTKLDLLVYLRNFNEQFYSDEIELDMKRLENEDRCFEKFCEIAKGMVSLYLEQHQETGLNENEIEKILKENDVENPKYLILQGLEKDNLNMFKKAIQIQDNDPSAYYYKGLYEIKQQEFKKGMESLLKAKQLFQNKIDDEQGFQTAFDLNRLQIEQFSKDPQENQKFQKEKQTQMLPQLDLDNNPFSQYSYPDQKQQKPQQINQEDSHQHNHISNQHNHIPNQRNHIPNQHNHIPNQHNHIPNQRNHIPNIRNDTFDDQNIKEENENNQKKQNNRDSKTKNHIEVYKRLIKNINETLNTLKQFDQEQEIIIVIWTRTHHDKQKKEGDDKDPSDEKNSSKDKQEVIIDGPLPLLGKVIKTKKEKKKKKWWQYLAMFVIGAVQFVFGCAVSAISCGAAIPIAKSFITGGISDMVYSVTAAWKGLDIDWGAWGKNKMINVASALVLAGPSGVKEALQIGGKGFQSIKQIGITEFLKQIPTVTVDGLKKAGFWLSDLDKVNIQNQYQTLQMIQQTALQTQNNNQILNLATEVLGDQVRNGAISESTASNLYDLVNQCFQQSKGTVNGFRNSFCELAKKYLRLQIAKSKSSKSEKNLKKEVEEICQTQGNKKFDGIQSKIHQYQQK
ncbi:unnamed protein product [Paramecium pentaurelia]|uniref:P-loop containing nucleoside triphosphate hydrolase n=1 Tax=Paramecium pentaurelia TaxID=43138 RepID=A0A8S1XLA8_9CILI|nr:unnamed protein product [Paramecium pentaurelia]